MTEMQTESNFMSWAREEIKRAGLLDQDSDYDGMLGEEVLRMCEVFDSAGHSGFSAGYAASVFSRLSAWRPLTQLTDDPDEWMDIDESMAGEPNLWQSRRNPACFSNDGGKTYYDIDERQKWWRRVLGRLTHRRWAKFHKAVSRV